MIAIIDYNAGNMASIKNAIERAGFKCEITSNPQKILKAEKVIFPGQGRAGSSMKQLRKTGLDQAIKKIKAPFLGICLGMQLLADFSEEDSTKGLSIIKGDVVKFPQDMKTPQIGWNKVFFSKKISLTEGIENGDYFYFVNSYYFNADSKNEFGYTNYGIPFASIVNKNNFYGVQFHPEKSGKAGEKLLSNFLNL